MLYNINLFLKNCAINITTLENYAPGSFFGGQGGLVEMSRMIIYKWKRSIVKRASERDSAAEP